MSAGDNVYAMPVGTGVSTGSDSIRRKMMSAFVLTAPGLLLCVCISQGACCGR